jgi:hypothetical protein
MIAALIVVLSFAALLEFFVAYSRSLIATYGKVELSEDAHEVTGIEDHLVSGEDFKRLLHLLHLCPEPGDDRFEIRAVGTYYAVMGALRAMARGLMPAVGDWAEGEREGCAYFAAVALDRRITHNRDLMAQQMSE